MVCSSSAIIFAHDAQYSFWDERKGKRRKRRQMNQEKRFGEGGRREYCVDTYRKFFNSNSQIQIQLIRRGTKEINR
jgi:hypothetical protein